MSDMFKDAAKILKNVEKDLIRADIHNEARTNWQDPREVLEYRSSLRRDQREVILDRIVPNRMCPLCDDGPFAASRQWVISRDGKMVVCRSCFMGERSGDLGHRHVSETLFVVPPRRFGVNGFRIQQVRELAGLTRKKFADLCGWTDVYQLKIERGDYKTIKYDTADTILQAFARVKITTQDDINTEPDIDETES